MKDQVFNAALAGLLHDIGKFAHRAGIKPSRPMDAQEYGSSGYHALLSDDFTQQYVPKAFQKGLMGILYHHKPKEETGKLIQLADWWSSGERLKGFSGKEDPGESRLIPILSRVELKEAAPDTFYRHSLEKLQADLSIYPVIYDKQKEYETHDFNRFWTLMCSELDRWKKDIGDQWEKQDNEAYLLTLQSLLRKYCWCIPAATPWQGEQKKEERSWPDVSLYDHMRLTSAIAACLAASKLDVNTLETSSKKTVAVLLRGDLSGIQNFIFRISRPDADTGHIAKRLRGRSFYVAQLMEVVADWLRRSLELPTSCLLFVGGGKFDILVPVDCSDVVEQRVQEIEEWLLDTFSGELGLPIAACPLTPADFADMRRAYRELEEQLDQRKHQKWSHQLSKQDSFFMPESNTWHVCRVCQLTPLGNPGTCSFCKSHEQIGKHLPHTEYLGYYYGNTLPKVDTSQIIRFERFDTSIVLLQSEDVRAGVETPSGQILYKLNSSEDFIQPNVASSYRFLANEAPKAGKNLGGDGFDPVSAGDVLTFERIAELSTGARRLGVLKADVDRLGLVMGEGLENEKTGEKPTISRMASLSSMMDLFFSGVLNQICKQVSAEQKNSEEWYESIPNWGNSVDELFYILYSGGDDFFIIGPWDAVLKLAEQINIEFHRFGMHNPNLTISAGYVQVKPRFPVQKFAEWVHEAEKDAKDKSSESYSEKDWDAKKEGRNQFTAFGQVMKWEGKNSYAELSTLAQDMVVGIRKRKFSRNILADLGQVYRQHFGGGKTSPMWTPRLFYSLSRRMDKGTLEEFRKRIFAAMCSQKIIVPVSIASLITRKE